MEFLTLSDPIGFLIGVLLAGLLAFLLYLL